MTTASRRDTGRPPRLKRTVRLYDEFHTWVGDMLGAAAAGVAASSWSHGPPGPLGAGLLGVFVLILVASAYDALYALLSHPTMMAHALTKLAVVIGGRKRAWRGDEWAGDLATGSDPGSPPGKWARMRYGACLVVAAVCMRAGDLLRLLGRMLDWTLAEPRTEVLVGVATLCTAGYFWRTGGLAGVMSNFENVLATAVLTSGPALWLRKHRAVPPARRRKREATRR
jgi:hypothetical protein